MTANPTSAHAPARAPTLPRRLSSFAYEGLLLLSVIFVFFIAISIFSYLISAVTQTRDAMEHPQGLSGLLFVIFGIYFTWFWSRGQTLAMKTWKIRIQDRATGNTPSQAQSLIRYVLSWLWFLPPLAASYSLKLPLREVLVLSTGWIAVWAVLSRFHPQRQFWHDAWAGTELVTVDPTHKLVTVVGDN